MAIDITAVSGFRDVQEFVSELEYKIWPVCPDHGYGLHATARNGSAVWWCRVRAHAVGHIGELAG